MRSRSFSTAWHEIAVGHPRPPLGSRGTESIVREDFQVNVRLLRRGLLDKDYEEIPIRSEHGLAIDALPPIHGDPLDRILIAQATIEGIELLTADQVIARYPGTIRLV